LATARFKRQRNGYPMRCKPPGCRQSLPRAAGESVPGTWSGLDCRRITQLRDSSEGMSWACMVLSLMPHQIPRHGAGARLSAASSVPHPAEGCGCQIHPPTPAPPHPPGAVGAWRTSGVHNVAELFHPLGLPRLTSFGAGAIARSGANCGNGCEHMARDSGIAKIANCTISTGPAEWPERDSGRQ
jgi:hypothetical protein